MRKVSSVMIAIAVSVGVSSLMNSSANAESDWCSGTHNVKDVRANGVWGIEVDGHQVVHESEAYAGECMFTRKGSYSKGDLRYTLSRKEGTAKRETAKTSASVEVTADTLNVRKSDTTDSPILRKVTRGTTLRVEKTEGGWIKLSGEGWVKAEFTKPMDY